MAQQTLTDQLQRYEISGQLRALRLENEPGPVELGRHTHSYRRTGRAACSELIVTVA